MFKNRHRDLFRFKAASLLPLLFGNLLLIGVIVYVFRPTRNQQVPDQLNCLAWNPFHTLNNEPNFDTPLDQRKILKDLKQLAPITRCLRLYTSSPAVETAIQLGQNQGFNFILGAWITPDKASRLRELTFLIYLANKYSSVTHLLVGNETILSRSLSLGTLLQSIRYVKARTNQPVSTGEPAFIWEKNKSLAMVCDFIAIHLTPFWVGPIEQAKELVKATVQRLRWEFPSKVIMIAETGWPTAGQRWIGNLPSAQTQLWYLNIISKTLDALNTPYVVIEAYDVPWKSKLSEGAVGSHWGIFRADNRAKEIENWDSFWGSGKSWWRSLSIVFTILTSGMLWLFARRQKVRVFFLRQILVGILVLFFVIILRGLEGEYFNFSFWNLVFVLPFGVLTILLIFIRLYEIPSLVFEIVFPPEVDLEAHRLFSPKVSVHVACRNEDPTMVIATLTQLLKLDYPTFEIIVLDNNSRDLTTSLPVEAFCRNHKDQISFYRVAHLSGYKAGALNWLLHKTAPDSEIIAVVDADYLVNEKWLSETIPGFVQKNIAVVQCPQNHVFSLSDSKALMMNDEYDSFFAWGMRRRTLSNSIIVHGTMVLIRKSALMEVGAWSPKSIVEDTDLGVRLQSAGYQCRYVHKVFGAGCLPDSYEEYARQRFRWAYGATRILLTYPAKFFLPGGGLSLGQKWEYLRGWSTWLYYAFLPYLLGYCFFKNIAIFTDKRAVPSPIFLYPLLGFIFTDSLYNYLIFHRIMKLSSKRILFAAISGMALANTIGRAILTGLITAELPFRVTKKGRIRPEGQFYIPALFDLTVSIALLGLVFAVTVEYAGQSNWDPYLSAWIVTCFFTALPGVCIGLLQAVPKAR